MPRHCDSLDGPVVRAAVHALDAGDVELVLPFVPEEAEEEVETAFELVTAARALGRRRSKSRTATSSRPSSASTESAKERRIPASSRPASTSGR